MYLSVIIPVYNEESTVGQLLDKVLAVPVEKEIIIVDDESTDSTREILEKYSKNKSIKILYHEVNKGKGASIRTAIPVISGDVVIIQDADLEYDPNDYLKMIDYYKKNNLEVLYGSRFLNSENKHSYSRYYFGGRLLSYISNILFLQNLTDEPTCYKMIDTSLLKSLNLKCEKFEFCPELTAKVAKRGYKIHEIPISYYPRKLEEGKKIRWYDGLSAIWTLLKYRFFN